MYKIEYDKKALLSIDSYNIFYKRYFQELYEDSWLLWEEEIINWYIKEANNRSEEIFNLISDTFSRDELLWKRLDDTFILRWRTKYLFIKYKEDKTKKVRIILDLEIR